METVAVVALAALAVVVTALVVDVLRHGEE